MRALSWLNKTEMTVHLQLGAYGRVRTVIWLESFEKYSIERAAWYSASLPLETLISVGWAAPLLGRQVRYCRSANKRFHF